uniref:Uncharacterized protein n=1 Tax=Lotharella globosa TaxID=91324 RepID=A0A6V3U0N0_9EUKA
MYTNIYQCIYILFFTYLESLGGMSGVCMHEGGSRPGRACGRLVSEHGTEENWGMGADLLPAQDSQDTQRNHPSARNRIKQIDDDVRRYMHMSCGPLRQFVSGMRSRSRQNEIEWAHFICMDAVPTRSSFSV